MRSCGRQEGTKQPIYMSPSSVGSCAFACESERSARHLAPHACSRQLLPAFPPTSLQSGYQRLLEEHQQQDGKSDEEDGDWRLRWLPGYRKPSVDSLLRRTRTRESRCGHWMDEWTPAHQRLLFPTDWHHVGGFVRCKHASLGHQRGDRESQDPRRLPPSSLASSTSVPKRSVIVTSLIQSW